MASILFVAPSAYILGGLQTWLDYLEPGLLEGGWEVTVGLVAGNRYHIPERYILEHSHKQWISIPCKTGTPEGRSRAIVRAIKKVRPDVIVSVNIPDVCAAVSRIRLKGASAPRAVMSLHGIQPDLYDDIREYATVIDGVVCTNRLACKLAEKLGGIDTKKIYYAPCGVPISAYRAFDQKKSHMRIAYVGRLERWQKRVHDIPAILKHLDEMNLPFKLFIIGDGPENELLRKELKSYVEIQKVAFLGSIGQEELRQRIYPDIDVLLLTSFWETGPIVIWEAMASSVAVVSTRYVGSGVEDALKHNENVLLFTVGDAREAALQLRRVWDEKGLRKKVVQNSYRLVTERYSIDRSVGTWGSAFRSVIESEAKGGALHNMVGRAAGRLDRIFSIKYGETIRNVLRLKNPDGGPDGEWPHSYGTTHIDDSVFWSIAQNEDSVSLS